MRDTRAGHGGRQPPSSVENQMKQGELVQIEAVGRHNDFDPLLT